jgi:hypothetical protein
VSVGDRSICVKPSAKAFRAKHGNILLVFKLHFSEFALQMTIRTINKGKEREEVHSRVFFRKIIAVFLCMSEILRHSFPSRIVGEVDILVHAVQLIIEGLLQIS